MQEQVVFEQVVKTLLYVLPMYFANSSAMVWRGQTPIDLDVKWVDGKPIFGKGKTVRGTLGGMVTGTFVAFGLHALFPSYTALLTNEYLLLGFLVSAGGPCGTKQPRQQRRSNS